MKIIVQKFGGTSVSTPERRKLVISKIKDAISQGFAPVVVVSAMGRKGEPYATDTLLSLLKEDFKKLNKQATDLLMCCGEIISSVVMCNELSECGIEALPLTGGQAGIITDSNYSSAALVDTNPSKILELLSNRIVPVITGFQGVDKDGYFTTLGRGGSDTSASILGVALKAERIEIFTDVDGILTADPRMVANAQLIDKISYNEVFQFAEQGAKVIHPRAVEIAMRGNIPLVIRNTMSQCSGTIIDNLGSLDTDRIITGITHVSDRLQVIIKLEENKDNKNYKSLLDKLAINKVSLDLINIFPQEKIFTVDSSEKDKIIKLMEEDGLVFHIVENCSKIAIIGSGMRGIPGVMANILGALDKNNIEVLQTADSHMTIWCLIHSENVKQALNALHNIFL